MVVFIDHEIIAKVNSVSALMAKEGYSRSRWEFPDEMRGVEISHNPHGWKADYFQSASRGQEFIIDVTPAVMDWVKYLFDIK